MHPALSFEQAPPIDVPYRFFLTAPLFGMAAGVLLAVQGDVVLASRWTPAALAGTHLLVAGFMLQAMCGALLQFVPVAAGGNVWRPRFVATIAHVGTLIAAAALATGFLTQDAGFLLFAAALFVVALGIFVAVVGSALWRTPARGPTLTALRGALFGLLVTLCLGASLAGGLAQGRDWPLLALTDIHAAWGLGGWALLLLAGVSYAVVPMFQLTPAYPSWLARGLPWLMMGFLLVWSWATWQAMPQPRFLALAGLGVAGLFAAVTLYLQYRRRRPVADTMLLFFRTAMLALLATWLVAAAVMWVESWRDDPRMNVALGLFVIVGGFVSAINGMLYKIVPFLGWLHLQNLGGLQVQPPSMQQMIPATGMRGQFRLHLAALGTLLAAVWLPALARPAGLLFALSCGWLAYNLGSALRVYRRFRNRIGAAASDHGS